MKSGEIAQTNFTQVIPFEYRMNLIVIKPIINGKERHMIFDTGAPNVITKELANELKLETMVKQKTMDSQGANSSLGFCVVPKISLAGIDFIQTAAAIADFSNTPEMSALQIDGIIGANLMRKATWKIDFQTQKITFTSNTDTCKSTHSIPFIPTVTGTPIIDVTYDGVTDGLMVFDTGSNGDITGTESTFRKLRKKGKAKDYIWNYGNFSAGLYGLGKADTTFTAVIDTLKIGNIKLNHTRVDFSKGKVKTVGLQFTSNYRTTIDWKKKKIYLEEITKYQNLPYVSIGFSVKKMGEKIFVANVFPNTDAARKGLTVGQQIKSINQHELTSNLLEVYEVFHTQKVIRTGLNELVLLDANGNEKRVEVLYEALLK